MKRYWLYFCMALLFLPLLPSLASAKTLTLAIDGQVIRSDTPPQIVSGRTLVPVRIVSEYLGATVNWNDKTRTVLIDRAGQHIEIPVDRRQALVGKKRVSLDVPAKIINGRTMVPIRFIVETFQQQVDFDERSYQVRITTKKSAYGVKRVMLDAGHGGYDSGALGPNRIQEKQVVLNVTRRVKTLLEQSRIEVRMTRSSDAFVGLEDRAQQSQSYHPDLFVSIHANSSPARNAYGSETYYRYGPYRSQASVIQNALVSQTGNYNRGVKQERLWVLKPASVPSVLVETAFISNPREERLLNSSSFQDRLAEGIAAGIRRCLM